ncbi:Protein TIFY 11c [Zea mays]|uniref:Protein TIFY n=1 Tax=Zea mays TaxID=4577 RepID=C0P4B4_MAIZE|nr:Protein TIFY 11c [Zea mays]ACN27830.1 unknown [Zea mays]ONL94251.1 Protein TIFY 10B [Zea mays]
MASEHAQLSAKAAAGSRFAVTYGLLRQYMKEQGGSGATRSLAPAVGVGLMPEADAAAAAEATEERTTVLELFPQQAGTLKDEQQRKRKERADGRAPLTIFYGGKMVVFDDFPAEKAEELMQLAGSGNAAQDALGQPSLTDMPLARKVSLKRFLEKRKNRLTAADPYPAAAATAAASESSTKPPAVKDEGAPWVGVNSALSLS